MKNDFINLNNIIYTQSFHYLSMSSSGSSGSGSGSCGIIPIIYKNICILQ